MRRPQLTLGRVFVLTLVGLAALLALLFSLVLRGSRASIVSSSGPLRDERSEHIGLAVESYLYQAEKAIADFENQIRYGDCRPGDALSVEAHLFAKVLDDASVAEVAFTRAEKLGPDDDRLAAEPRWQVSVFRDAGQDAPIRTRFTWKDRGGFVADVRDRPSRGTLLGTPLKRTAGVAVDPTQHPTFMTPARSAFHDELVWSDLSYTELDGHLPESERRVVVTVMKALDDRDGRFAGVARVGLLARQLDATVRARPGAAERTFLCDSDGRLVTRVADGDVLHDFDGDLRVVAGALPPEIGRALRHEALGQVDPNHLKTSGSFVLDGRTFLVSFRGLARTQGWRIGIVIPEDALPGIADLVRARDDLVRASLLVIAVILIGGIATLRTVQRGLDRIVESTARMRNFDFAPAEHRSAFRDVQAVMERVELAKTAMRAMGKYVPIDLVRLLYKTGREPRLGGELVDVSLMFTDIKDFTALSERVAPDELALVLGRYLEVMTRAIHAAQGTIDKYIGDAIMAVWNVPTPCPGHAGKACEAALACLQAGEMLYASPEWAGRPRLETRFGLHTAEVMVGHFGAPDRMSFTALGDGVNLASRLEGLNKQYGTTVIASEAVHEQTKEGFTFRLLDVVAVKGKTHGVRVYELLGDTGITGPRLAAARRYEQAFAAYLERRFDEALRLLEAQETHDPPSAVLAERCRRLREEPPPEEWTGVYVATSK